MNKRIFVAIDISGDARRAAEKYISELKREFPNVKVGWEKAEKLHLTLKFLGDSNERQIGKLFEIVDNISKSNSKLKLRIANPNAFPASRNARVLWLGVEGDAGRMQKINAILENECEKLGFEKNKKFKPHLTIGRIRGLNNSDDLVEKHLENKIEPVEFEAFSIVIYESKLQPTGSIYRKLKEFNFSPKT